MAFDDRLFWLLLGLAIGYVVGRLDRRVRDIEEELHDVDERLKQSARGSEDGFMHIRFARDIAVIIALIATVTAAVITGRTNEKLQTSQNHFDRAVYCNQKILTKALGAQNQRAEYAVEQVGRNIKLQRSQRDFLSVLLHRPPYSEAKRTRSVKNYYEDLSTFLEVAVKNKRAIKENPLPTIDEFSTCLRNDTEGEQ